MEDGLAETKRRERKAAAERRAACASRAAAESAARLLVDLVRTYPLDWPVSGYLPFRTEIDPLPAMTELHQDGRRVCVPVVAQPGLPLLFREWVPGAAVRKGTHGIEVPVAGSRIKPRVIVAPLLAFDRDGARLGYGGGYYDRTLEAFRRAGVAVAVGFAFAGQETTSVPSDSGDQKLDIVVTENEIFRIMKAD